jgi:hypothetical protein
MQGSVQPKFYVGFSPHFEKKTLGPAGPNVVACFLILFIFSHHNKFQKLDGFQEKLAKILKWSAKVVLTPEPGAPNLCFTRRDSLGMIRKLLTMVFVCRPNLVL